jgi:malate dehydrogenase (oxaloacetate-decarboxylating)
MYLEAASAIASLISPTQVAADNIVPSVFDERVVVAVAAAVQRAARQEGIARC